MEHSSRPKVKAIYQYHWLADKRLRHQSEELIGLLSRLDTPFVILKGLALGSTVYPDTACRPTTDIDLFVDPGYFAKVVSKARSFGFICRGQSFHATALVRPNFPEIDIHRSPYHRSFSACFVVPLFDRLVSIGPHTFTLGPEDQLLHTIAHGTRSNVVSPLRWVVDAVLILRQASDHFSWELLVAEAVRLNLIDSAIMALQTIHSVDPLVVDADAIRKLENLSVSVGRSDLVILQDGRLNQGGGPLNAWLFTKGNADLFGRIYILLTYYLSMWGVLGTRHMFIKSRHYFWYYISTLTSKLIPR
jgi:hypothetical protein